MVITLCPGPGIPLHKPLGTTLANGVFSSRSRNSCVQWGDPCRASCATPSVPGVLFDKGQARMPWAQGDRRGLYPAGLRVD